MKFQTSNFKLQRSLKSQISRWQGAWGLTFGVWGFALSTVAAERVNFSREILPILSDNCFKCHGPDEKARKAKLRLDTQEGAFRVKDGVAVIVSGKSAQSELVRRITTKDADDLMPPPESNKKLTPQQIVLLRRWIEEGAKWGKHWAFEPPQRVEPPKVKKWPRNPIDNFILARLDREKLKPSPEAPRETLIRRVTLDLTGLPPTPEEVDAFLADKSADAYEKLVDRLLASPRYGERMVWEWLDTARYADTNGYQGDPIRAMWYWRDWSIEAINKNMPFDQFTIQQLAGDLLPEPTLEQKIATGFHRNHMINGEGGAIAEEQRVNYVFDRVETTGTVWLGLTIGCARCHDHKFDPISQREYYQLAAFFNSIDESGGNDAGGLANPIIKLPAPPELEQKLEAAKTKEAEAKKERDELESKLKEEQPQWEAALLAGQANGQKKELTWTAMTPAEIYSDKGTVLTKAEDGSVLASGPNPPKEDFVVVVKGMKRGIKAFKLEALPDDSFVNKGPGRSDNGNFVLSELQFQGDGRPVELAAVSATFEQQSWPAANAFDGKEDTGWAVMPEFGKPHTLIFEIRSDFGYTPEPLLSFRLKFQFGREHVLGKFRLYATYDSPALLRPMPDDIRAVLAKPEDQRSADEKKKLREYYFNTSAPLATVRKKFDAAKASREAVDRELPRTMIMRERAKPRDTFILERGNYQKPLDKVTHGSLAVLNPLPSDEKPTRLALAKWLVAPTNPLTARVTINRHWQIFFGTGLVKTTEDFGVQGEKPSHPELLDWLAMEFVRTNWDVKALHKLIVTSATYRQSSKVAPKLVERDPENRLLARGPRFRLPSWMLRDQALAVSGLLVEKLGGPPVKVYQPEGVWEEATFGQIRFTQDHGEALYRRSLYVFWRRIVGPTIFFDVANRQTCSVKTSPTNTPLHSLALLNDITYVEASRKLAERVMTAVPTPSDRIALVFRLCTARKPTAAEEKILAASLDRFLTQYQSDKSAAEKLLKIGESKRNEKLNPAELAAYSGVCSLILNLDEVISKE